MPATTDRYAETKATILELTAWWLDAMHLSHWTIKTRFVEAFDTEDHKVMAITESMWEYEQASIKWHLPQAINYSADELEQDVIHELVHVLLSPEQSVVTDRHHERKELTTERVAKALYRAWQLGSGTV